MSNNFWLIFRAIINKEHNMITIIALYNSCITVLTWIVNWPLFKIRHHLTKRYTFIKTAERIVWAWWSWSWVRTVLLCKLCKFIFAFICFIKFSKNIVSFFLSCCPLFIRIFSFFWSTWRWIVATFRSNKNMPYSVCFILFNACLRSF